ncbi:MAG: DNA polymerase III subunit gamma/tau [Geobacteraceae bacterium]
MSYLVLARKWRPQTFSDLIGQEHVSRTLKNAIDSGRVAHAFLFTGARGVGKTSAARILAKTLNCEHGPAPEPCNVCSACQEITVGNSVDVFEIDGASNTGVDDIRELRDNVKYLPSHSRFKIFIIDEVHMLSTSAFNALLKTLEEPPPHVKFIFATTEPHKIPITILSRCQRFDFKRIPLSMIAARLRHIVDAEQVSISDAALVMVSRKGDGSMRDALSTLDQVLAFCGQQVGDADVVTLLGVIDRRLLVEASGAVFARDCAALLEIVGRVDDFGYNMRQFCQEMIDHFRNLTMVVAIGEAADLSDLSEAEQSDIRSQAAVIGLVELQRHLTILLRADMEMAHSGFPRLILEMALLKMATMIPVAPVQDILEKLRMLEGRVSSCREPIAPPYKSSNASPVKYTPTAAPAGAEGRPHAVPVMAKGTEAKSPDEEWIGFVDFVRKKKPLLAALLGHGHPVKITAAHLEIGLAEGSFELRQLRATETVMELKSLANAYFQAETSVTLVPLPEDTLDLPPTLLEKKSLEMVNRQQELRLLAADHPAVVAALEIFGGELGEIRK